jgi:hypothetical protein
MTNCELWQHEKYVVPGLGFRVWADRFRVTPLGLPLYAIDLNFLCAFIYNVG